MTPVDPAGIAWWWNVVIAASNGPQHVRHAAVMLFALALVLLTGRFVGRSVAVAQSAIFVVVTGAVTHKAWMTVMVGGQETYWFTVHCIWFNGLLCLTFVLLIASSLAWWLWMAARRT